MKPTVITTTAVLAGLLAGCSGSGDAGSDAVLPCHTYNQVVDDYNYHALRGLKLEGRVREVADQADGTSVNKAADRLYDAVGTPGFIPASKRMAAACGAEGQ